MEVFRPMHVHELTLGESSIMISSVNVTYTRLIQSHIHNVLCTSIVISRSRTPIPQRDFLCLLVFYTPNFTI